MPMDKKGPQPKAKKKVKAVSAKDLNPDGTVRVKSNAELKAEHEAKMLEKVRREKKEREAATAARNEEIAAREAAILKKRAEEAVKAELTVETISEETGPQTVATVVAKSLGMPGAQVLS